MPLVHLIPAFKVDPAGIEMMVLLRVTWSGCDKHVADTGRLKLPALRWDCNATVSSYSPLQTNAWVTSV
jgi:hypothetical protein